VVLGEGDAAGVCRVWWCSTAAYRLAAAHHLSPTEATRAAEFRREEDRRRFILGVAVTRAVIGRTLGIPAADVPLDRRCPRCGAPHGRPRLPDATGIELSVTHSGKLVGLAVRSRVPGEHGSGRVGVDVEAVSSAVVHGDLADEGAVLSPSERDAMRELDLETRRIGFLTYWVRKEAVLKATGSGLLAPMSAITVTAPWEKARIVRWDDPAGRAAGMRLIDLTAAPDHLAALAVDGMAGPVVETAAVAVLPPGRDG
jgi:4'-phosphopantetheinyl transferase